MSTEPSQGSVVRLENLCSHIRTKNAGPYWVTADLFFDNSSSYEEVQISNCLNAPSLAGILNVDPKKILVSYLDTLRVIKISYPRANPQGWRDERDMHSGQQFVLIAAIPLDSSQNVRLRHSHDDN